MTEVNQDIQMSETAMKDLMYLSNKRVLLSNPGTKLNSIYYSAVNTVVDSSEVTYNTGRLSVSLSQTNFGSQSQIIVPNSSLLSEVYLHLELPAIVGNQTLCRGWALGAIDNISYLFGSSNVSQISISGQTIFQILMCECQSEEKRTEMFKLAGEEQLLPTTGRVTADIILPLPWSSACAKYCKLPFDTNLLSNPITINITFKASNSIYGGVGVRPAGFNVATMLFRQGDLTNKDQSLKYELMKNPQLMYSYPFVHKQSYTVNFTGQPVGAGIVSLPLLAFINADLLGISFGVVRDTDLLPQNNNTPNPFNYEDIRNLRVTYNGLTMLDAPERAWKLMNMQSIEGSSKLQGSVVSPGGVGPFSSDPKDTYPIYINFARIRAVCFDREYQNVWRIANNVLTLDFNTLTTDNYRFFATYYYNGVSEIQNGETRVYFD